MRLDPVNNVNDKTRIIRWINLQRNEIAQSPYEIEQLHIVGELATVANVTAGTVSVSSEGSEVTGSSTSWASTAQGRYFQLQDDTRWYRIGYFSAGTSIYLETPHQISASAAGKNYVIWKKFYDLPNGIARINRVFDYQNNRYLESRDSQDFEQSFPKPWNQGFPVAFTHYLTERTEGLPGKEYTTGTVSINLNDTTVTGSSTAWVGNVFPGDRFKIGSNTYHIQDVLGNTLVRLVAKAITSATAAAYTASRTDQPTIIFSHNPNANDIYRLEGNKQLFNLQNDDDFIEDWLIDPVLEGAKLKGLRYVRAKTDEILDQKQTYANSFANLIRGQKRIKPTYSRLRLNVRQRF